MSKILQKHVTKETKQEIAKQGERCGPLWLGPEDASDRGGITFSMLSRFLADRERFRLYAIEGLRPADDFNHKMEYGNMWHACEEGLAAMGGQGPAGRKPWQQMLQDYAKELCRKYPMRQEQVNHWYEVCKALFPLYSDYWRSNPDVVNRTPLLQEQVFDVPYSLPSGRTIRLRGKWDAVDLIGKGKAAGIFIQENKTKSGIDGKKILREMSFDLQTLIYLVAADWLSSPQGGATVPPNVAKAFRDHQVLGVRYNVVRRSAHKSVESMLKKVAEDREAGRIGEWFARWCVRVSPQDVAIFRRQCLDPILEQLCEWYDWVRGNPDPFDYSSDPSNRPGMCGIHFRLPYGTYSPTAEDRVGDYDSYLADDSEIGLTRTDTLFEELKS